MTDRLIRGAQQFEKETFPAIRGEHRRLVEEGQSPSTLLITCSDSRIVPHALTGAGPGDLFVVRNAGAFVPPSDSGDAYPGTGAGVEFAVTILGVTDIVVCGHSHCGAIRALYETPDAQGTSNIARWLELGRDAWSEGEPTEPDLRRAEQRAIGLQLGNLMTYPAVRRGVDEGHLSLHGWHYILEDGVVLVLDRETGEFGGTGRT